MIERLQVRAITQAPDGTSVIGSLADHPEAARYGETARTLCDRVLLESRSWLDESPLESRRRWRGIERLD